MTKPPKPSRPLKLLRALFDAQQAAAEVPATTTTRKRDAGMIEESTYAGSEDVTRTAKAALHGAGIMPTLVGSTIRVAEGGKAIVTLTVSLLHLESGQELVRSFEVEVAKDFGSAAATTSGYAMALRLLLCLSREPEAVVVSAPYPPEPEDEEPPRETVRRVFPAPLVGRVAKKVGAMPTGRAAEIDRADACGDRETLQRLCQEMGLELAARKGSPDHQGWKSEAKVSTSGSLSTPELGRFADWLLRQLDPPPQDSGAAWAEVEHEAVPLLDGG